MRAVLGALLLLSGCSFIDFDEYDYDTHRPAHIGLKKIDADVDKVRGGVLIKRKMKFGQPPRRKLPSLREQKEERELQP